MSDICRMIKVSIVEDHNDFRLGLQELLTASEGFACVDAFTNAEDAVMYLTGVEKILLLDINLPGMSGIEAIPKIKALLPDLKIIMLTMLDDDNTVLEAILSGADGYLLKKTKPLDILKAITDCQSGGSPMTPAIAGKVLTLFKKYIPKKNNAYDLTSRETEILHLLVDGIDSKQIAENLSISFQTVRNHIRHIYEKLQVHSKSQAVVKALREGLV